MEQNHFSREDRDLLVELRTEVTGIRADIKEIKDGTSAKLTDHETRLRSLEKQTEDYALVKKLVYSAVGVILLAVFSSLVYLVIK